MKNSSFHRRSTALLSAIAVSCFTAAPLSPVLAHEGEDQKHSHGTAASGSVMDAWKTAQQSLKGIETAAAAKEHAPIHDEQEKLAGALKQIQEQNGATGADKTRLDGAIKNAVTASEKVHTAADEKDFAKVDSSLKTLQATMGLLEKQLNPAAK
ncbi:MAG: hypothetical protein H0X73_00655 [Chthoniobacterales bacterium]|nr:hypothetical protein [Chthoniobacterales bacterium]